MKPFRALAFMIAVFALPLALALILWIDEARSRASWEPPEPNPVYVVSAGDTLWSIARAHYPEADPRKVIHAILELKDRKSTRLNSSHVKISYAVFCLKKK